MCAIRRALAELRLAATTQPRFPALLDDGRFTPTPTARPRQAFPDNSAYDGLLSSFIIAAAWSSSRATRSSDRRNATCLVAALDSGVDIFFLTRPTA